MSPFTGNFVNGARGTFNPATGTFAPSFNSSAALTSRRDLFLPTSGSFVPSPFGAFRLTTRDTFNPATNTFTPSPIGGFVFSSRGTFVPSTGGAVTTNPFASVFSMSPFGHLARRYERAVEREALADSFALSNPYLFGAGYGNPYMSGGYGGGYGSGYPIPYGTGSAYGTGTPNASPVAAPTNIANSSPNANAGQAKQPVLAAFGIPNEFGEVIWPSAFRLLSPDKRGLLKTLEAQLKIAAEQAVNGNPSSIMLRQAKSSIDELKTWLSDHQPNIGESQYQDADRFLRGLTESVHRMEP